MALWRERLFSTLARNAGSPVEYFNLPTNRVVEQRVTRRAAELVSFDPLVEDGQGRESVLPTGAKVGPAC